MSSDRRHETPPRLTSSENWARHFAGIVVEIAYVLALAAAALIIAAVSRALLP